MWPSACVFTAGGSRHKNQMISKIKTTNLNILRWVRFQLNLNKNQSKLKEEVFNVSCLKTIARCPYAQWNRFYLFLLFLFKRSCPISSLVLCVGQNLRKCIQRFIWSQYEASTSGYLPKLQYFITCYFIIGLQWQIMQTCEGTTWCHYWYWWRLM